MSAAFSYCPLLLPQTLLGVGPCFRAPPVDLGYIEAAHEHVTHFTPASGIGPRDATSDIATIRA